MKYEVFKEKFNELSTSEKLSIFNNYCIEHGDPNNEIHSFDEEFFETYFSNPMDAARSTFFGKIKYWTDDYIKFNAYGNLESMDKYDVLQEIDYYLEEIFDNTDTWEDYIDNEEEEEEEEEEEIDYNFKELFDKIDTWEGYIDNEEEKEEEEEE